MYGDAHEQSMLVSLLWWYSVLVPPDGDIDVEATQTQEFNGSGIYCFEGRQDARPEGGILYIGLANGPPEEDGTPTQQPGQSLRTRVNQSLAKFQWATGRKKKERGLWADVWDLRLRWANVKAEHVTEIEAILIHAHAPSFNRQHVRGAYRCERPRLILNDGEKGRLLPVLSSLYFDGAYWNNLG